MKKSIKRAVCSFTCLIIALVAFVNFNVINDEKESSISFVNVEALAHGEWNDWYDCLTQGLTKDERSCKKHCPAKKTTYVTIRDKDGNEITISEADDYGEPYDVNGCKGGGKSNCSEENC